MNKNVFVSLLALDSYNRGYDAGLNLQGNRIGNAGILLDSTQRAETANGQSVGFYASAYNWAGKSVISYRGTNPISLEELYRDAVNGWTTFTGLGTNSQFDLARKFNKAVVGFDFPEGTGLLSDAIVTGHSLGGALAGFVAARSAGEEILFDPIPYAVTTYQSIISDAFQATIDQLGLNYNDVVGSIGSAVLGAPFLGVQGLLEQFAQTFANNIDARTPNLSNPLGFYVDGEIAHDIIPYQGGLASLLIGSGVFSILGLQQLGQAIANATANNLGSLQKLDTYGVELGRPFLPDTVAKHSPALPPILLFGKDQWGVEGGGIDWTIAAKHFLPWVFDDDVAAAFHLVEGSGIGATGTATAGEQLARIIAYSAINEGTRVFGDTGIRALFNDGDDLGKAMSVSGASEIGAFVSALPQIGHVIAEFSGLLATNKVTSLRLGRAKNGVATFFAPASADPKTSALRIDLTEDTWTVPLSTGEQGSPHTISVRDDLVKSFFDFDGNSDILMAGLNNWSLENVADSQGDIAKSVQEITINFSRDYIYEDKENSPGTSLFVLSNDANSISFTEENATDIVIGGDQADRILGGSGNDVIFGRDGIDTLVGGTGNDWLNGGADSDTIWGDGEGQEAYAVGGEDYPSNGNDTVSYADSAESIQLRYEGQPDQWSLKVFDSSGSVDTLHSVENVVGTGKHDIFSFVGVLTGGTALTIDASGGQGPGGYIAKGVRLNLRQAEGVAGKGYSIGIDETGEGAISSTLTGAYIRLIGFGTEITGSDFDDNVWDASPEDKVIDTGDGNDTIQVENGSGLAFGGEGNDLFFGGIGNDTLIGGAGSNNYVGGEGADLIVASEHSRDPLTGTSKYVDPFFTGTYLPYEIPGIRGGIGSDYITVVSQTDTSDHLDAVWLAGDEGNDYVVVGSTAPSLSEVVPNDYGINLVRQLPVDAIGYHFKVGDGHDQIVKQSSNTDLYVALEGIDWTSVTTKFEIVQTSSLQLADYDDGVVEIYEATYTGNVLLTIGTNGDSIVIENVIGRARSTDQQALLNPGNSYAQLNSFELELNVIARTAAYVGDTLNYYSVKDGTNPDLPPIDNFSFGAIDPSYRTAAVDYAAERSGGGAQGQFAAAAANAPQVGTDANDQFSYSSGDKEIDGGAGSDRFSVGGDLSNYNFSFDGNILVVSDKWGLVGTTRLTGFETLYDANTGRQYSMAEVAAELVRPADTQLSGDADDNAITGANGHDRLLGLAGNDVLTGLGGDDRLDGGSGDDILDGGAGNDTLKGGTGIDTMSGGTGDDRYYADDASDVVSENANEGTDTVYASLNYALGANVENLRLEGSATIGTGNALDNRIYGQFSSNDTLDGGDGTDYLYGDGGNDVLFGGDGSDGLFGGDQDDQLFGGNGNDLLDGGSGDDVLNGGDGNDALLDGGGNDTLLGGLGDDRYYVTTSTVIVSESANEGIDTVVSSLADIQLVAHIENGELALGGLDLTGNAAPNILRGNDGNNRINGGDGDDTLFGGVGADRLSGGAGNDVLNGGANGVADPLTPDFDIDGDTAIYSGTRADYAIEFQADGSVVVRDINGTGDGEDRLVNIERVAFLGEPEISRYRYISGPTYDGSIADVIFDEDSQVSVAISPTSFSDPNGEPLTLTVMLADGTPLPAWLTLSNGTLTGTPPANFFGDLDILLTATGATGAVSAKFNLNVAGINDAPIAGDITETIASGASVAGQIVASDADGDGLAYTLANGPTHGTVTLDSQTGSYIYAAALGYAGLDSFVVNVDDGQNGIVQATVSYTMTALAINGTSADDTLVGTSGAEVINGFAGNDALYGGAGDDTLDGGDGNDKLYSGPGADTLIGGAQTWKDLALYSQSGVGVSLSLVTGGIAGDAAGDSYTGIEGVGGSSFADEITGDDGDNYIFGGDGDDVVDGGGGSDDVSGNGGSDVIHGGDGNDFIFRDDFDGVADQLFGDAGDDYILGGAGDQVDGGAGNDQLEIKGDNGAYFGGDGNDSFNGFVSGTSGNLVDGGLGWDYFAAQAGRPTSVLSFQNVEWIWALGTEANRSSIAFEAASTDLSNVAYSGYLDLKIGTAAGGTILAPYARYSDVVSILRLYGAEGDDQLTGSALNDTLKGGGGNDALDGGGGIDTAVFSGVQSGYSLSTSGGTIFITDNAPAVDGDDGTDTLIGIEKADFSDVAQVSLAVPIVLDLNGDGVTLIDPKLSRAWFDWDGDGASDKTGWVGKGDGILVYDRNGDGKVGGANELSFVNDKPGAKSDLDGLSAFDSNRDGLFSEKDAKWGSFRVWTDRNVNGRQDKRELLSLAQAGVASITLAGTAVDKSWSWEENITVNTGTFTRTNGNTGALGDVGLRYTATRPAHSLAHVEASIFGGNAFAGFDRSTLPRENGVFGDFQREGLIARQAVDDSSAASAQASAARLAEAIAGFGIEDGGLFTAANDRQGQRHDYHFAGSHGPAFLNAQ